MGIETRLKELRLKKGISQAVIAEYLGVTKQAYSLYELGKREPDFETLLKLGEYFDVTLDYLLKGNEQQNKPLINDDEELTEYLEELKNRSEMRMLFKVAKGATKADVEQAVKIIEALRKDE